MTSARPTRADLVAAALVLLIVAALFAPALGFPFLSLDDHYGVVENPGIRNLSWDGVRYLFLDDRRDFRWFPLAYLSFAVDYALSGLEPGAFHRTNVLLHLANTALVFALVRVLSRDTLVASVASLLFGIHPLQVESVAWVSSRKNVLFLFFFLLAVFAYLDSARSAATQRGRSTLSLAVSVGLFFLAITAKTTAATLPAVLLLVDRELTPEPPPRPLAFLRRHLASKLAYLPVIALAWVMTSRLARDIPLRREQAYDALDWLVVVGHNFAFYVAKALAPIGLGVFYPLPDDRAPWLPLHHYGFAGAALLGMGVCAWSWRRHRLLFFGSAWYLITISPMAIQPVLLGDLPLVAADRYFYQSSIGLFLLVGVACRTAWQRLGAGSRTRRGVLALVAAGLAGLLLRGAWQHEQRFRSDIALYEQTVRHHPSDEFYYRLALEYGYADRMASAFGALDRAERAPAQIFFTHVFVYQMELSELYRRKGDFARAAALLEAGIESTPNAIEPVSASTPLAWRYLASLWAQAGDPARASAARARAEAVRLVPQSYFESQWFQIAPDAALRFLEARVVEAPDDAVAWYYLGRFHQLYEQPAKAEAALRRAAELGFGRR